MYGRNHHNIVIILQLEINKLRKNHILKKWKRNADSVPLRYGDQCWSDIPGAWVGLGLNPAVSWIWGSLRGCARQWASLGWTWTSVALCISPWSPDPGWGVSCSETKHIVPKGYWTSEMKQLWKVPWVPSPWWWNSHLQPHSLWVAPPTNHITFHRKALKDLGYVQGIKGKREMSWNTRPGDKM